MGKISALLESLRALRRLDASLAAPAGEVLLTAAVVPDLTITKISGLCDLSMATTSRLVSHLGTAGALGKPGLGLLVTITDPENHRTRLVGLSNAGRAAVEALVAGGPKGSPPAPEDPPPAVPMH